MADPLINRTRVCAFHSACAFPGLVPCRCAAFTVMAPRTCCPKHRNSCTLGAGRLCSCFHFPSSLCLPLPPAAGAFNISLCVNAPGWRPSGLGQISVGFLRSWGTVPSVCRGCSVICMIIMTHGCCLTDNEAALCLGQLAVTWHIDAQARPEPCNCNQAVRRACTHYFTARAAAS